MAVRVPVQIVIIIINRLVGGAFEVRLKIIFIFPALSVNNQNTSTSSKMSLISYKFTAPTRYLNNCPVFKVGKMIMYQEKKHRVYKDGNNGEYFKVKGIKMYASSTRTYQLSVISRCPWKRAMVPTAKDAIERIQIRKRMYGSLRKTEERLCILNAFLHLHCLIDGKPAYVIKLRKPLKQAPPAPVAPAPPAPVAPAPPAPVEYVEDAYDADVEDMYDTDDEEEDEVCIPSPDTIDTLPLFIDTPPPELVDVLVHLEPVDAPEPKRKAHAPPPEPTPKRKRTQPTPPTYQYMRELQRAHSKNRTIEDIVEITGINAYHFTYPRIIPQRVKLPYVESLRYLIKDIKMMYGGKSDFYTGLKNWLAVERDDRLRMRCFKKCIMPNDPRHPDHADYCRRVARDRANDTDSDTDIECDTDSECDSEGDLNSYFYSFRSN